jgi:hypothetical protein
VCDAAYGRNGWLGLASIWISGTHITQGTVKLNDTYYSSGYYNTPIWRASVTCQEIGHTFGLDHQSTDGSSLNTCMDYYHNTSATDLVSTTPNQHDYDELATIYAHLDAFSTVGASRFATPVAVGAFEEDGTPRGASPERGDWYLHSLGAGRLIWTHVYWSAR